MVYMNEGEEVEPHENERLEYGEKLSNALIEFASKNLKIIKFSGFSFKFSLKTLDTLLENWRDRNVLSIITSDPDYGKEEYTEIINKYKNDGMIKDFRPSAYDDDYFSDLEMMM